MPNKKLIFRAVFLSALVLATIASAAVAQNYPVKAIHIVVPFPPGGGTDVIGRLFGQMLASRVGQQVVVDNRAGAGGRVGAEYVARSSADGYTLLVTTDATIITAPSLFPKL